MMLSSRSDEFGLVHVRRDETGETDARRDGLQVRTTRHLHGKRLSRPNEHDHAGREDQALQEEAPSPERSLGAVSMASAPCKSFSQRDLPSTRYAHMMRQGTTLKTMDARPSATNQCHRNTTPATARTVSTTTHPRRLNITLRTRSMTSRHRHEYFRGAAIRGDLMDRDRLGSGPRHAGQVSRHTRNGNADNLRSLCQELADRTNRYVADYDIAIDE